MIKKKIDFKTAPESDVIIKHTISRLRKGLYTLILVTGLPGTGKSSTSQRYAELLYESQGTGKFTKDDVVDSLLELLRRIRKIKNPGEIIVIEEVSVLFPSRRAMSRDNVDIARVLDTIRKKEVILISNAPIFKTIDNHFRSMANVLVETIRINKTNKIVVSKAWKLQTNPGSGQTYKHTFQRQGKNVKRLFTKLPDRQTWKDYESKKDKFMDKLYEKIEIEADLREKKFIKQKPIGAIAPKRLSEQDLKVHDLHYRQGFKQVEIANQLGVSKNRIWQIVTKLRQISENTKGNQPNQVDNLN